MQGKDKGDGRGSRRAGEIMRGGIATALAFGSASISGAAFAQAPVDSAQDQAGDQAGIADIIVTAQKREENLQTIPVSVSALTEDALEANRVTSVLELNGLVPNLLVRDQPGGASLPTYTMRGIINQGAVPGVDKGVAVYIDGVYLGASTGSTLDLADIARIEVLRGPQGTLFGRNATAGAINFITTEPGDDFAFKQVLSFGNRAQFRSTTSIDTGAFGAFSASAMYSTSKRRGDIRNLGAGTVWDFTPAFNGRRVTATSPRYLGGEEGDSYSIKLRFEPNPEFRAVYRYQRVNRDYTAAGFGLLYESPLITGFRQNQPNAASFTTIDPERPDAVNNWDTTPATLKAWGHTLTTDWQVSDAISLKNTLSIRNTEVELRWTALSALGGFVNNGAPALANLLGPTVLANTLGAPLLFQISAGGPSHDKQWSDELQLNYDSDFVDLTFGALYYHQRTVKGPSGVEAGLGLARSGSYRVYPDFLVPYAGQPGGTQGRLSRVTTDSVAAYGHGEFHVAPSLDLAIALRYTHDRKKGVDNETVSAASPASVSSRPISYSDGRLTYDISAKYELTPDHLVYLKYSTGYVSGGSYGGLTFEPEKARSFEGGLKADWFGRMLRTNLAVFHVEYDGLQSTVRGVNLTPPQTAISQAVINAGDATAKGFELETILVPHRDIMLNANLGYLDFKFDRVDPRLMTGNDEFPPMFRPKWTANLAAQYSVPGVFGTSELTVRFDANWRSSQAGATIPSQSALFGIDAAEQDKFREATRIRPYWLVNGRIELKDIALAAGATGRIALWGRNIFDDRSPTTVLSLVSSVGAMFEAARTYGVDFTVEF